MEHACACMSVRVHVYVCIHVCGRHSAHHAELLLGWWCGMLTHAVTPRAFLFSQVRIQRAPADAPAPPEADELKEEVVVEEAEAMAATEADEKEVEVADLAKEAASSEKSPQKATKAAKKKRNHTTTFAKPSKKAKHGKEAETESDTESEVSEKATAEAQAEKQDHEKCTVKQLQKTLKAKGLNAKGCEHVLIGRMQGAE